MRPSEVLIHRVGRRGAILILIGVVDLALGASMISPSADSISDDAVIWREHYAPLWAWGGAWLFVGLFLIIGAFRRRDALSYAVAIGWKITWAFTSFASWAFGGVDRGWVATFIWGVVAGIVLVVSGWPEPPPDSGTEG